MEAILGIVGTLLGTVLGWLLARWNIGKLYISLDSFEEKYYRLTELGGVEQFEFGILTGVELNFAIHLYNSFPVTRAIRECQLVLFDSAGFEITRLPVEDKASARFAAGTIHYDDIGIVNLNGYTSKDVKGRIAIFDLDLMYKISKIEFHYKNEKRKEKVLQYKKIDFASVPRIVEKPASDE